MAQLDLGKVSLSILDDWSSSTAYEILDMVNDSDGNVYISKQAVPAGTALTNTTYWKKISGSGGSSEGAVLYSEAQSLTDSQKLQARTNIGAGTGDSEIPVIDLDLDTDYHESDLDQFDAYYALTSAEASVIANTDNQLITLHVSSSSQASIDMRLTISKLIIPPSIITFSYSAYNFTDGEFNEPGIASIWYDSTNLRLYFKNFLYTVDGVSYSEAQSLTDAQKLQARTNIGASVFPTVTSSDNGKVLTVVNGDWAASTLPTYNGEVT